MYSQKQPTRISVVKWAIPATHVALVLLAPLTLATTASATPGEVLSHQKISDTQGGFTGILDNDDYFGRSVASLGDLDGDGVGDLAVGARLDDDGGLNRGAVWVLFLNTDGTVRSHQKISDTQGGFTGALDDYDLFGSSVASLGDLDGDGVGDLVVGAFDDDDGGMPPFAERGAVWVLFLDTDGTVKSHQKISDTQGGFIGALDNDDLFGFSVASLGDLDGNGVGDLAVGAFGDDDGGPGRGAVWVLFLNTDGTVKSHQKISDTQGGFTGTLDDVDLFGFSVASLGDLDGDGVGDLAVGAFGDDDGGSSRGAVWVLFLNTDGTVQWDQKISDTKGDFTGTLDNRDSFGSSVASLGDLDGDGVGDLAVGARLDDDGGATRGAVWVLFLDGASDECGNGIVEGSEECEPPGSDCCDASCQFEPAGTPCTDDGNPCTDDVCDGTGTCEHPNDDTNDCDDGTFCNGAEYCSSGECISPGDPCATLGLVCDEEADECRPLEVALDIKPGSDPNSINCNNGNAVIPVAVLTTEDFDATNIDHTTVTFEGASEIHMDRRSGEPRRHEEDVDGDGDIDLVFHFSLAETDLTCDSTEGTFTGETFDGQVVEGTDEIRMLDNGLDRPSAKGSIDENTLRGIGSTGCGAFSPAIILMMLVGMHLMRPVRSSPP